MKRGLFKNKEAVSAVVSSIILCACVLVVGVAVWGFSYSTGIVLQGDYWEGVNKDIQCLKERFLVENIAFNSTGDNKTHVWVYNYGDINIEIDVYILRNGSVIGKNLTGTAISINEIKEVVIIPTETMGSGENLVIEVVSARGNFAYEKYQVL